MEHVNINKCRACLTMDRLQLFDWNTELMENLTYMNCFRQCTQLEELVHEPPLLCYNCATELKSAYDFIQQAKESDRVLRIEQELIYKGSPLDNLELNWVTVKEEGNDLNSPPHQMSDDSNDVDISPMSDESNVDNSPIQNKTPAADCSSSHLDEREKSKVECRKRKREDKSAKITNDVRRGRSKKELPDQQSEDNSPIKNKTAAADCSSSPLDEREESKVQCRKRKSEDKSAEITNDVRRGRSKKELSDQQSEEIDTIDTMSQDIVCVFCNETFPKKQIERHMKRDHKEQLHLCNICSRTFKTLAVLRQHAVTHEENRNRNYACEHCGRKFFTKLHCLQHTQTHNSNRKREFKCDQCDKSFLYKCGLNTHKNLHNGKSVECQICQKHFLRPCDLKTHLRNHSENAPHKCKYCGQAFKHVDKLNTHVRKHEGKRYKCDVCEKDYSEPSSLSYHRLLHIGPLQCAMCDKRFGNKSKLRRHIIVIHRMKDGEEVDKLIIDLNKPKRSTRSTDADNLQNKTPAADCSSKSVETTNELHPDRFKKVLPNLQSDEIDTMTQLENHLARDNTEQLHSCHICPRTFKKLTVLQRHVLTHEETRDRNYACEHCGRKFFTKIHCLRHTQTHNSNRKREFKCDQCDKSFLYLTGLNTHKNLHNGKAVECQICQKQCMSPKILEIHMRSHSGYAPYECTLCGQAFKYVDKLNNHVRKHEGYRYKCDVCEKDYSELTTLKNHRLLHFGPLQCAKCNTRFGKKSKLRRHIIGIHRVKDAEEVDKLIIDLNKPKKPTRSSIKKVTTKKNK